MKKPEGQTMELTVNGENYTVEYFKVNNDKNGNARYVVHFLDLGIKLDDYGHIPGLSKYTAKWFGRGYVFQAVNMTEKLTWMIEQVQNYYANK